MRYCAGTTARVRGLAKDQRWTTDRDPLAPFSRRSVR
jgi:hypothetical protein